MDDASGRVCRDVRRCVRCGVRIECDYRFPNGDGLHIGGCRDVMVSDCVVDAQDDALVIRTHQEQMKKSRPCERVMVNNCVLRSKRCYAIRMGWRGDGPMKDISLNNVMCPHSRWGISFFYPDETTDWAKKPSAADIFRAVDGFEFIDTKFSLSAKSRR